MFDSYKHFIGSIRRGKPNKPGDSQRFEKYIGKHVMVMFDRIANETPKAMLFIIKGQPHWLPRSQITVYIFNNTVEMPLWMARSRGLYQ